LDAEVEINSVWEMIRDNKTIAAKEYRLFWTEEA
jgi:hypothetical protein